MKKIFDISAAILMGAAITSCVAPTTSTTSTATTTQSAAAAAGTEVLGTLLNGVVSSAAASGSQAGVGGILGNLISSVTGSVTTTQASLQGTWSYIEPSVQFESENLLTQAGGTAMATQVETKLGTLYNKVGIKQGKMVFTFGSSNQLTYQIGSFQRTGTYSFDSANKIVTITTSAGATFYAYVTVSGQNMSLCFDSTKVLSLLKALNATGNATLNSISTLADSFSGMKTGFKFVKQ